MGSSIATNTTQNLRMHTLNTVFVHLLIVRKIGASLPPLSSLPSSSSGLTFPSTMASITAMSKRRKEEDEILRQVLGAKELIVETSCSSGEEEVQGGSGAKTAGATLQKKCCDDLLTPESSSEGGINLFVQISWRFHSTSSAINTPATTISSRCNIQYDTIRKLYCDAPSLPKYEPN
eukprot:15364994-Ditylum_brightwellii.AAC.1